VKVETSSEEDAVVCCWRKQTTLLAGLCACIFRSKAVVGRVLQRGLREMC